MFYAFGYRDVSMFHPDSNQFTLRLCDVRHETCTVICFLYLYRSRFLIYTYFYNQ